MLSLMRGDLNLSHPIGIEVLAVSRLEVLSEGLANAANGVLPIPNLLERQEQLRLKRVLGFQSKNPNR